MQFLGNSINVNEYYYISIGGVFLAGVGIYASEILFQLGFFSGLGVAMQPLLTEVKEKDSQPHLTNQHLTNQE